MLSPSSRLPPSWSPSLSQPTVSVLSAAFDGLPFRVEILRSSPLSSVQLRGTRAWPSFRKVSTRHWLICARKWPSARYGRDCGGAVRGKSWGKEKSGGKHTRMRARGKSRRRENGGDYPVGQRDNLLSRFPTIMAGIFRDIRMLQKLSKQLVKIIVIHNSAIFSFKTSHLA